MLRLWRKNGIGNLEVLIGFVESNPSKNPVNKTYRKDNDEEGTNTGNPTLSSINSIITIITIVIVIVIVKIRLGLGLGPVDGNVGCSQTNNTTNQTKESYEANNGDVDEGWQDESMSLLTESCHDQSTEHDVNDVEIRHAEGER